MRRKTLESSQVLAELLQDLCGQLRRQCRLRLEKLWIMRQVLHHDLQLLQLDTAYRTLHIALVLGCCSETLLSHAELLTFLEHSFRFYPFQQLIVWAESGHDLGEDRGRLHHEEDKKDQANRPP